MSNGRSKATSFLIIDAQSVKNTDTAKEKGYDGGKQVSGIKRHIGVDTNGLPHAVSVTTANVSDKAGAVAMVTSQKETLADVEVVKRNELHTFKVLPVLGGRT